MKIQRHGSSLSSTRQLGKWVRGFGGHIISLPRNRQRQTMPGISLFVRREREGGRVVARFSRCGESKGRREKSTLSWTSRSRLEREPTRAGGERLVRLVSATRMRLGSCTADFFSIPVRASRRDDWVRRGKLPGQTRGIRQVSSSRGNPCLLPRRENREKIKPGICARSDPSSMIVACASHLGFLSSGLVPSHC